MTNPAAVVRPEARAATECRKRIEGVLGAFGGIMLEADRPAPSKKNRLRTSFGGGHHDQAVADSLRALETEFALQWGGRPPVRLPYIWLRLSVQNPMQDPDNIVTALFDCLQAAGVLTDDCVRDLQTYTVTAEIGPPHVEVRIIGGVEGQRKPPRKKATTRRPRAAESLGSTRQEQREQLLALWKKTKGRRGK